MKKMIGVIVALMLILLVLTKSMYIEGAEFIIIIASLSIIAIIVNLVVKKNSKTIVGISALVGFVFFWIFGVMDLIVDHVMYYLPTGNEDGMALTLGMKLNEFNDDLFIGSLISMFSVITISILSLQIINRLKRNPRIGM